MQAHLEPALAIYNHYILRSTANFHEKPVSRSELRRMISSKEPGHGTFSALSDGHLLGFGWVGPYKARCAYRFSGEVSIYVAPGALRRGAGAAILSALERKARAEGIRTLIAGICLENRPSLRFFGRQGYRRCARFRKVGFKFGRPLDTVYAQKMLASFREAACSSAS